MKTNRSNLVLSPIKQSFRLHRLTKTNSLQKTYDGHNTLGDDSFKLEAIHSINKGVKYNDLSYITGRELNKLRKEPAETSDMMYENSHATLMDIRKKYDDVKKQCLNKEATIYNLKEEKQRYEIKQNTFDGSKGKGRSEVQQLQESLQDKKLLLETTQTEKKVLQTLRNRHNQEKVFYDQRKFDLEKELQHYKKQIKIFDLQEIGVGEQIDRASKIYEKLSRQVNNECFERQMHIQNLENRLYQKSEVLQGNEERGKQMLEIAERAMLDKNPSEKQWEKILLTHTFLNKMLRHKIDREMEKFKVVEFAFKEIKTATGVSDAQNLVHKYLNKEQVYGQLLGKIAENEKQISILKIDTEELLAHQKELEAEKQVLQNTKVAQTQLHDDLKELTVVQQKTLHSELLQTKVNNWIVKQFKKFSMLEGTKEKPNAPTSREETAQSFKKFLSDLSLSLDKANELQVDESNGSSESLEDNKLVRIIPKKARKNSLGEEIFDMGEEETSASNQAEENELISHQREDVIRNNEKFMKEMKKKRMELRAAMIEAMEKKEKAKAPEVKKPQQEDD